MCIRDSHIHDHKFVRGKSEAIFSRRQFGTADVQLGLGDKHALILLLDRRGVSGDIDQSGKSHFSTCGLKPSRVPQLRWRLLPGEEIFRGHNLFEFVGAQQVLRRFLGKTRAQKQRYRHNRRDTPVLHGIVLDQFIRMEQAHRHFNPFPSTGAMGG